MKKAKIPVKFKTLIKKASNLLLSKYKDTKAIFLIGSIADNSYNKFSDIDLVWVKSRKLKYKKFFELKEKLNSISDYPKIQLVLFTPKQLKWHFDNSSTMAHSIKEGIIIYGKRNKLISNLLKRKLSLPKKEWMKDWFKHWLKQFSWTKNYIKEEKRFHKKFCKNKCHCMVNDDIARVVVNFSILYLETKGIIPLSKRQIFMKIKNFFLPTNVFQGIKLALKFSGKDRYLTLKEAKQILFSAHWFKRRLIKELG
jgi:predicted nucleotidyltransferase